MMPMKADLAICSSAIGVPAWIVQECGFRVKPLFGFQLLRDCSGFLPMLLQTALHYMNVIIMCAINNNICALLYSNWLYYIY